ncbi:seryl-tRNA synthetase [Kitasatospora sp. MAP12-15]|uniref:serine--tRNA ligase n=1 Tax=unclassified Kitasatospora TaxID=2633591 RepID=UPI00247480A7|nr:serine--tRNA ligase [Kitasatospora sp. MAP12-44]MDH6110597.1 seryl-tRNA synthetase [Kitasatospora sp. MAP12-44]
MHDVRELIELGPEAVRRLARRKYQLDLTALWTAHRRRAAALDAVAQLRSEIKRASRGPRPAEGAAEQAREEARVLREGAQQAEAELRSAEAELEEILLAVPNLPLDEVPDGDSEKQAVEVRRGGPALRPAAGQARHHADIGESLGILDSARAAKLSGSRFAVSRGAGARLERALTSFLLDLHTSEHGYTEYAVPHLVNRETMTGTGQLPKFEEDLFATSVGGRELFLIPTAEVPLTNMVARELLDGGSLPLALTARTPCYRAEAGSYGRDTRGILRLHQFEKVELVRICALEEAQQQLMLMVGQVEECLRRLELSYRVVLLPAGDMGFSARMTYDIEVWLPGSDSYREISSVSDCGTFQGRRAGIRYRSSEGRKLPAATLNGSALPVGRTVAALLEQGLQADGSVLLPEALVPYTGFRRILPGGGTSR